MSASKVSLQTEQAWRVGEAVWFTPCGALNRWHCRIASLTIAGKPKALSPVNGGPFLYANSGTLERFVAQTEPVTPPVVSSTRGRELLRRELAVECLLVFVECDQDRYAPDMPGVLARHAVAYADALLAELDLPKLERTRG